MLSTAVSITHQHLLSVVNTTLAQRSDIQPVRVLDAGCGNGQLLAYFQNNLPVLNPPLQFELYGFDVHDHGVQHSGYMNGTAQRLLTMFPGIPWNNRLESISVTESWPYPDNFFDAIVSNQVLEHVNNHDLFFAELSRTLCQGGFSAHLFPLKHCLFEGHLHLPLAHKIGNFELLKSYIKFLSWLGLGKYPAQHKDSGIRLDEYSERHADYLHFFTNYITYGEAIRIAKRHRLRISFKYTREFYTSKLKALLRCQPALRYDLQRSSLLDWFSFIILRYVSSVTLFLEKQETYTQSALTSIRH